MDQHNQPTPSNTPSNPENLNTPSSTPLQNTNKKVGPIVAVLVVVIIIVIIALFAISSNVSKPAYTGGVVNRNIPVQVNNVTAPAPEVKSVTGTSDDLNSLQADLNASVEGVDAQSI